MLNTHKVNQGKRFPVALRNRGMLMRTTLKAPTPAVDTHRALQREVLHELDDGQVVMRHLAGEAQAFGALVDRYQTRLLNFVTNKKNWEADHRPLQFEDTTARPDDLYRKRFLKDAVDQCVQRLPEHHREVFVLRELEGKSYQEIAEITGCNLGTVKSRLNRARNSFAQLIGPILV